MNYIMYTSTNTTVPGLSSISINDEGNPIKELKIRNSISAFRKWHLSRRELQHTATPRCILPLQDWRQSDSKKVARLKARQVFACSAVAMGVG